MLEQFLKNYSPWERPKQQQFMKDCILWEEPQAGVGEQREKEEVSKRSCCELTRTPIPHPSSLLGVARRYKSQE